MSQSDVRKTENDASFARRRGTKRVAMDQLFNLNMNRKKAHVTHASAKIQIVRLIFLVSRTIPRDHIMVGPILLRPRTSLRRCEQNT